MKADVFSEHRDRRGKGVGKAADWSRIVTEYEMWVKACNKVIAQKHDHSFCYWWLDLAWSTAIFFLSPIVPAQTMEGSGPELDRRRLL